MKELVKLCKLMLPYLDKLYEEGSITKEEYEKHIKIKLMFLELHKGMEC